MTDLDFAVIAFYFAGMVFVGWLASRKVNSVQDYAIAGGKLGFPVLLGTLVATQIGGGATLGRAGKAYEVGIAIGIASLAYALGLYLFTRLSPVLRRLKVWTIPGALDLRYGPLMRIVVSVVILITIIALFSAQLIAFGLAVVALSGGTGVTFTQAVLVAAVIMVAYTVVGGFFAVAYTDLIQAVIMVIGIGIMLPVLVVSDLGGPAVAVAHLKPDMGNFLGGMAGLFVLSFFVIDIPAVLIDVSLWQRNAAASSDAQMKKALYWTIGVFVAWSVVAIALGIWASVLLPELGISGRGGDAAIPELIILYMPPIAKGLCLAALMAVMMSTADTALLLGGTTMGFDVVKALKPEVSDKTVMRVTRTTIVLIGVIGSIIALGRGGLFEIVLVAMAIYVSGAFFPTMAALFWRRATSAGALASTVGATLCVLVLYAMKKAGTLPHGVEPIFVALLVSAILLVGVSVLTGKWSLPTTRLIDRRMPGGPKE